MVGGALLPLRTWAEGPPADELEDRLTELSKIVAAQQAMIAELKSELSQIRAEAVKQESPGIREAGPQPEPADSTMDRLSIHPATSTAPAKPDPPSWSYDFYGYIKLDASYDTQQSVPGNLAKWVVPEGPHGPDDEFNFTAKQSRFGVRIKAPEVSGFSTTGRAEIDFYGSGSENAANPRLRLAHITMSRGNWSYLAGQDYDTTQTLLPKTVNFATGGWHGALWSRRPQLRATYRHVRESGILTSAFGISRTIGADLDGLGQEDGKDFPYPTLQGKLQYEFDVFGRPALAAVSGLLGREVLDSPQGIDDREFDTELIQFSLKLPLTDHWSVSGQYWFGQNLSRMCGGIGQGINLARDTEIAARGGWIQAAVAVNPAIHGFFTYGFDNPDNADLSPGDRASNSNLATSWFFDLTSELTWALEYSRLETRYISLPTGRSDRVQSALIFGF